MLTGSIVDARSPQRDVAIGIPSGAALARVVVVQVDGRGACETESHAVPGEEERGEVPSAVDVPAVCCPTEGLPRPQRQVHVLESNRVRVTELYTPKHWPTIQEACFVRVEKQLIGVIHLEYQGLGC